MIVIGLVIGIPIALTGIVFWASQKGCPFCKTQVKNFFE